MNSDDIDQSEFNFEFDPNTKYRPTHLLRQDHKGGYDETRVNHMEERPQRRRNKALTVRRIRDEIQGDSVE